MREISRLLRVLLIPPSEFVFYGLSILNAAFTYLHPEFLRDD